MLGRISRTNNLRQGYIQSQTKTRFLWADSIRILAIFLVIATHLSYQPDTVTTGGIIYFLYFSIVKTCIPLFVMLSGALLLGKNEDYKTFYKKRLGRLIMPWLFWSFVSLFIIRDYFHLIHGVPSFFRAFVATMESFWFLPMIVGLYLLTPMMRTFVQNSRLREVGFAVVIWLFVVSILPYHHNSMAFPRQVDDGLVRQVVNFVGYYLLGYFVINLRNRISITLSFLIFFCGLSWITIMTLSSALPTQQILYLFDYVAPGNVIMSLAIFALLYAMLGQVSIRHGSRVKTIISSISSCALGIYFIHGLIWPFLQEKLKMTIYPLPVGILSTVILFLVCFMIILLLRKIPIFKTFIS